MSAINVNSITGRTGTHGPVLTGVTTATNGLHVGSGVSVSGISTFNNTVVGGATTELVVGGDARITGILTVGQSSVTISGDGISGITTAGITTAYVTSINDLNFPTAGALSNRNLVINGDHRVHQRGTSVSLTDGTATFLTDRFQAYESTGGSLNMANVAEGPDNFVNSTKITVTSADTSLSTGQQTWIRHRVEGNNIAHLNWGSSAAQTVTLSFYVRSSVTGSFSVSLQNSAGNRVYPVLYTISAANTWERKTITIPGETSGTWYTDNRTGITIYWSFGMASNLQGTPGQWNSSSARTATGETQLIATNGATWQITGVQLEVGSKTTPFEHRSYSDELSRCQRYYEVHGVQLDTAQNGSGTGYGTWYFKQTKRDTPGTASDAGGISTGTNVLSSTGWQIYGSASALRMTVNAFVSSEL